MRTPQKRFAAKQAASISQACFTSKWDTRDMRNVSFNDFGSTTRDERGRANAQSIHICHSVSWLLCSHISYLNNHCQKIQVLQVTLSMSSVGVVTLCPWVNMMVNDSRRPTFACSSVTLNEGQSHCYYYHTGECICVYQHAKCVKISLNTSQC